MNNPSRVFGEHEERLLNGKTKEVGVELSADQPYGEVVAGFVFAVDPKMIPFFSRPVLSGESSVGLLKRIGGNLQAKLGW